MIAHGRPLRFLAIVGLSWLCARLYFISPFAVERPEEPTWPTIAARKASAPIRSQTGEARSVVPPSAATPSTGERIALSGGADVTALAMIGGARMSLPLASSRWPTIADRRSPPVPLAPGAAALPGIDRRVPSLVERDRRASRLSGYAYLFARSGSGASSLASEFGQLGGSQGGVRLDYALSDTVAITARATSPLAMSRDREVAVGVKWRPTRLPVDLIVERRQSIGRGGRDAFALMVTGGVNPVALPASFRLEAYGQAGIVGLKSRDAFVEGQVTVLRDVARAGPATLAVGAGAWGGVQPGVERIDIGPRARLALPLGKRSVGLSLDYRRRVAGGARPGSGATLTLETSF